MGLLNRFTTRLAKIGITVDLIGNAPWIYLVSVNEIPVKENFLGNHGFTAFWYPIRMGDKVRFSDRRKVFQKIREVLQGEA